ncbi:MAG TPA: energy transducer TonB [Candidatus Omnitrophica bacterium]|nr:energy transducer TonB [Candidatus Omnitrophota bacterium]
MQNNKAIKTAFLISLMGHCLFLGMPGINTILYQNKQPEDVVIRVEIEKYPLLPDINMMGEKKKLKEIAKEEKSPEPKLKEDFNEAMIEKSDLSKEIIEVINPQDEAILRYQDMVKRKIQESRRYPPWAKKQEFEGISYLAFTLLSSGIIKDIRINRSSGFHILDKEAISTVKRASPFKPIPEKFNHSSLTIEVALVFQLE